MKSPFKFSKVYKFLFSPIFNLTILVIFFASTTAFLVLEKYSYLPSKNLTSLRSEVLTKINQYYYKNIPNSAKLDEGELKGLVNSLDDPYSEYLSKSDNADLENQINEKYEGVGISFGFKGAQIVANRVLDSGPAKEAGIQKGDILLKIDSANADDLELNEVANKIKGVAGSKVHLEFLRGTENLGFDLTRKSIESELVSLKLFSQTAVITISSFGSNLETKIRSISEQIHNKPNIKNLIIDLRGDTGGYLGEAVSAISFFVPKNQVVVKEKNKTQEINYTSYEENPNLENYNTLILVDKYSASSSEIMAGSLRDLKNFKLVGQTTYGKGLVQQIINISNGDYIKLTTSAWLTPKGQDINKKGLEPDIRVGRNEDSLDVALKTLGDSKSQN